MAVNGEPKDRGHWSGPLPFIMASAGAAIGLGNIWKFPYITGMNGGGAFVLFYLLCIALVGLPLLISEMLMGRKAERDTVGSFLELGHQRAGGKAWAGFGWLAVITCGVLLSFYAVIAGWAMDYVVKSVTGAFWAVPAAEVPALFDALLANPWANVIYAGLFMLLTAGIVVGGVKGGLEKANNILIPTLFILLTGLMIYGLTQKGAGQALAFMFAPDFSKLTGAGMLEALGHAFFSLGLGMGVMIVYGSYLGKGTSLVKAAISIAFLDTLIALMAGVMIFSMVFTYGLEPGAGPGLIFQTLPVMFAGVPGGGILATLFFVLLTFAALTSSISLLECVVAYVVDEDHLSRGKAVAISGAAIFGLGIFSALSFNVLAGVKLLGERNIFDTLDFLVSNLALPLGGLGVAIFTGWVMLVPDVKDEFQDNALERFSRVFWRFCIRFVAPFGIIAVLLFSLGVIKF
ncbi:MAG: sodium-dependent transporter [Candidatus Sericytochromatia bacterium]